MHSWRALAYWELGTEFTRTYDIAKPWDTPANLKAAAVTPQCFGCPNTQGRPPPFTNFVAVVDRGVSSLERANALGPGSPEAARLVLLIEYPNSEIPWTEPRDLDLSDLPKLAAGSDPDGLGVIFADGHFRRMPRGELLKLLGR